jgi:DNA-binding response OmpR family regulator
MMRVAVIEHDARTGQFVKSGLDTRGLSVVLAGDGASDIDVLALLAAIRAARPRLAVIALAASDDIRSTLDGSSCASPSSIRRRSNQPPEARE